MSFRTAQLISKTFLFLALGVFIAFHFLRAFDEMRGWMLWLEVGEILQNPSNLLDDPAAGAILSLFFMATLLIPSSPFLGPVWIRSKLAWGVCTFFAGVAAAGWWVWLFTLVLHEVPMELIGGGWCLIAAPTLNFTGLLWARVGVKKNGLLAAEAGSLPMSPADNRLQGTEKP